MVTVLQVYNGMFHVLKLFHILSNPPSAKEPIMQKTEGKLKVFHNLFNTANLTNLKEQLASCKTAFLQINKPDYSVSRYK